MTVAARGWSLLFNANCKDCCPPKHQPSEAIFSGLTFGSDAMYFTADFKFVMAASGLSLIDWVSSEARFWSVVTSPLNKSTANMTYPSFARRLAIFFILSFNPLFSWIITTAGNVLLFAVVLLLFLIDDREDDWG